MPDRSALGDRMKRYEQAAAAARHLPQLPVCVRLDGKRFSRFTRGLPRPFDARLHALLVSATVALIEQAHARVGYTQSDEITLVLLGRPGKPIYLDGRVQKLASILASTLTAHVNRALPAAIPEKADALALFDARSWVVPSLEEAANAILWREQDARRNAVSMAARSVCSHAELQGRSVPEMRRLLAERGVDWDAFSEGFRRGTYVQRRRLRRGFAPEELARLPPQHQARRDPSHTFERWVVEPRQLPPLREIDNRVEVLFEGAEPILRGD